MKVTVEIPCALFRRFKAAAARRGMTASALFTEALTEKLGTEKPREKMMGWRAVLGKLSPKARKAARSVDEVIRTAEFGKVDAEMWHGQVSIRARCA